MGKIIIAPDSFKGSASSKEVGEFIERGIRRVDSNVLIKKFVIGDGGEGTVASLLDNNRGEKVSVTVVGALGNKIKAEYAILDEKFAVIEVASSSGMNQINDSNDQNPFCTTTFGLGELIKDALGKGVKKIFIGLGGSATNDAGIGMAQALGGSFLTEEKKEIGYGAQGIKKLVNVDLTHMDKRLRSVEIIGLSDVQNPLCGKNGASYIFGPQKGAKSTELAELDGLLYKFSEIVKKQLGIDTAKKCGAGAAGGLGYGLTVFFRSILKSGIDEILSLIKFEEALQKADLVITGEGKMDGQSLFGKAPFGVAKLAKKYNIPTIAVVGSAGWDATKMYSQGIDLIIDTVIHPMDLVEALQNAPCLIEIAGETAYRAFSLVKREQ